MMKDADTYKGLLIGKEKTVRELEKPVEVAFLNEEAQDALDRQVRRALSAKWCETMRTVTLISAITGCIIALTITAFAGYYFAHHGF